MHEVQIIQATSADVDEMQERRARDAHEVALWRYLTSTAPSGVHVARDADSLVGVGFAHENDDDWYFSECFIEESFRNGGLASALLRAVAGPAAEDVTRSGMAAASDFAGLGLYAGNGVALDTPIFRVTGMLPDERQRAQMAAGDYRFTFEPIDCMRQRMALEAIDRDVRGLGRSKDHAFWNEAARGTAIFLKGEFVAYAYAWPNGTIGPLACSSGAYVRQVVALALQNAVEALGISWVQFLIPGTNTRALRSLLRSGLRIEAAYVYGSDLRNVDMSRYIGFHPWLF